MNETFWTRDYASHGVAKTGDKSTMCGVFVVKQVLNRI